MVQSILLVTPWYQPQMGGVATAVTALAETAAKRGLTVSVLLKKVGSRRRVTLIGSEPLRPRVYGLLLRGPVNPMRPIAGIVSFLLHGPGTFVALMRLIRRQHFDVINLHYPTSSDIFLIGIRMLTGVPLYVTIHGSELRQFESRPLVHRLIVRGILSVADGIFHSTAAFRDESLAPMYPRGPEKTFLIPLGIDLRDFTEAVPVLSFEPPTRFILSVANLNPVKGIDVLIQAFQYLAERHDYLSLVIVGDGPERTALQELAERTGYGTRIVFVGGLARPQVIALMKRSMFFVLPSRFESFGLVNLEAHACGKAVISTRVGGIPEVVEDGVSGLLVEPNDVEALSNRLQMLVEDPVLCARLGQAGFDAIWARGLTWEHHVDKYLAALSISRTQDQETVSQRS